MNLRRFFQRRPGPDIIQEVLDPEETALVLPGSIVDATRFLISGVVKRAYHAPNENPHYFSFAANRNHFKGHSLYNELEERSWKGLLSVIEGVEIDARLYGFEHDLLDKISLAGRVSPRGYLPHITLTDIVELLDGDEETMRKLQDEFSRAGYYNNNFLPAVVQEARKKKGVLFGISPQALRLPMQLGETADQVTMYLPEGLPQRYVSGIVPLGAWEKEVLENYFFYRAKQ